MAYEVRAEELPGAPVAVVRRRAARAELSRVVPEGCGRVWKLLKEYNVTGAGRNVAIYLDGAVNVEVGVQIGPGFTGAGEAVASSTPAGRVAWTTHLGPYQELHRAYAAIRAWADAHGEVLDGPSWELYGHWKQEWDRNPAGIRTDVYCRLR